MQPFQYLASSPPNVNRSNFQAGFAPVHNAQRYGFGDIFSLSFGDANT